MPLFSGALERISEVLVGIIFIIAGFSVLHDNRLPDDMKFICVLISNHGNSFLQQYIIALNLLSYT